jgi:hypothetical protein
LLWKTRLSRKARSELVRRGSPGLAGTAKAGDGVVVDTSRRFHDACPASYHLALRPTRGSGDGGVRDIDAGEDALRVWDRT